MKTNLTPSRNLIKYYNELYHDYPDKFLKVIDIDFNHSFKNLLGHYQDQNFSFAIIDSQLVMSDHFHIKNLKVHSFVNNVLELEVEWIVIFELKPKEYNQFRLESKVYNLKPILEIVIGDNVWEHKVTLKDICYPSIDQSF